MRKPIVQVTIELKNSQETQEGKWVARIYHEYRVFENRTITYFLRDFKEALASFDPEEVDSVNITYKRLCLKQE